MIIQTNTTRDLRRHAARPTRCQAFRPLASWRRRLPWPSGADVGKSGGQAGFRDRDLEVSKYTFVCTLFPDPPSEAGYAGAAASQPPPWANKGRAFSKVGARDPPGVCMSIFVCVRHACVIVLTIRWFNLFLS